MNEKADLIDMAADIVSAYVGNNIVTPGDMPSLIQRIYNALEELNAGEASHGTKLEPAVSIRKSVTPDYIICLEDGKKFKSLKRHLRTHYNLTPEDYRRKWDLPRDYPMVAPNYAQARSNLAKKMGLGQKSRRPRSKVSR